MDQQDELFEVLRRAPFKEAMAIYHNTWRNRELMGKELAKAGWSFHDLVREWKQSKGA